MAGWVEQKVQNILTFVVKEMAGEYSDQLWQAFSTLFQSPVAVMQDPTVDRIRQVAAGAALGILPVVVAWMAVKRSLETLEGASSVPPEALVRRTFVAGISATGISVFAWMAGTFSDHLTGIVAAVGVDISYLKLYFTMATGGLTLLLLMIAFLIAAGMVTVQRVVLTWEFTVLLIIGAFIAVGRVADDQLPAWQLWKREIISICLTPVVQLLLLLLFARRFAGVDPTAFSRWLDSFALLYLLWHTPKFCRQFTYSTGVGGSAAGLGAEGTRMMVMRRIVRSAATQVGLGSR